MTAKAPASFALISCLACTTPGSTPPSDSAAPDTPAVLAEARPGEVEDAVSVAVPWQGDPVIAALDDHELRAGLVLEAHGVELVVERSGQLVGPVTVSELPGCEAQEAEGSVKHELSTQDDARRVEFNSTCTPFAADGSPDMPSLHEESCTLSFEAGPPARWLVECNAYYEGGAHPDVSSVRHRFTAAELIPLPKCPEDRSFLEDPSTRERVHEAMNQAGCAPDEFEDYLGCTYHIPRPDGGSTLFLDLYLPRAMRSSDCDQVELRVELPK